MTNGTSQGLFVVVAIVIFGIFVVLANTLFGSEVLSNDLKGLFQNAIEQSSTNIGEPLAIDVSDNEDGTVTIKAYNQNEKINVANIQYLDKDSGLNLLKNSHFVEPLDYAWDNYAVKWYERGTDISIDEETLLDGYPTLKAVSKDLTQDFYLDLNGSVSSGDNITISFYAKSLEDTPFVLRFGVGAGNGHDIVRETVQLDSEFKRYSVTLKNQGKQNTSIIFRASRTTTVWMSKIQIEYGTKATEWKPHALNNKYNTREDSLELVTDKNGAYTFKMIDVNGREYFQDVVIDKF